LIHFYKRSGNLFSNQKNEDVFETTVIVYVSDIGITNGDDL